jgi:Rieske 2Fe-2S family protein
MPAADAVKTNVDLAVLAGRRKPGHSLEAPFYTSPQIFESDLELIFCRHWIFVAVEPEVAEPGDFVKVDVGRESVVIVRDDDMAVRAFHNVCRHRGARLVQDDKGVVGNLVCPYHQWTYDLTGRLVHAPNMAPDFDPACRGLKPVHVRSLEGLIFICLADEPPSDFDEMAKIVAPYLAPHQLRDCKVAKQVDIVEEGNWKLTMENNRECYHCGGHPELLRSLFHFFGFDESDVRESDREEYEQYRAALAEYEAIWASSGLPYKAVELLDGRPTGFRVERLALHEEAESYTMDTRVASKRLLGTFNAPRLGGLHLHTQPNSWHHFLSDHAVTFSVIPLEADKTLLRTTWLVHKDAVEGADYDVENLTHVWRATNLQDGAFVAFCQKGARSSAYEPGPYSTVEAQVDKFCNWYVERLGAHLPVR